MPDYVPTDWVNNVTPVDETRMDHLEAGVDAAVASDSELAAAVRIVANKLLGADANQIFRLLGDGKHEWGAGGASALDVNLYRGGADILSTDDGLRAAGQIRAFNGGAGMVVIGGATNPDIFFGSALDVQLVRTAADRLGSPDKFDPAGLNLPVKAGVPTDADSVSGAQDGDIIIDTTNSRIYVRVGGVWKFIGVNGGGSAGPRIDYENNWNAGTAYQAGDVVNYLGVEYLSVNDSTGQTPPTPASAGPGIIPLVTALPSTPFDGQEIILADSLTNPTYTWRLRYVAAKATNKWVFVGGAPVITETAASETTTSTTYANLSGGATGPAIAVPVAGVYEFSLGAAFLSGATAQSARMSYDIGATPATDADSVYGADVASVPLGPGALARTMLKTLTPVTLTAKYKVNTGTFTFFSRWMRLIPVAVGG